jgi:hypothetical protein
VTSLALLIALVLPGTMLRIVSTPGGQLRQGDTLALSLAVGDSLVLEHPAGKRLALRSGRLDGSLAGSRVVLAPRKPGSQLLEFGRLWGASSWVRLDAIPRRTVALGILRAGGLPLDAPALSRVEREVDRLLAPLGARVNLTEEGVLDPPRGKKPFWDRDGDGFLDLRRNMDSTNPDRELDSLVRWSMAKGASWPKVVVVGLPTRTGWSLASDHRKGDSILVLDRKANLPWRDEAGSLRRYRIGGRRGERPDSFVVRSYSGGSHAIRISDTTRGLRHPHAAATDWVTLPDFDPGPFGFTPWWRPGAPALVFPSQGGRLPERTFARLLAREVALSLGLAAHPDGRNLMCPIVRPDVADPILLPQQWRRLLR